MSDIILRTDQIRDCSQARKDLNISTSDFVKEVKKELKSNPEGNIDDDLVNITIDSVKNTFEEALK